MYQFPVKAIKQIIKQELNNKLMDLLDYKNPAGLLHKDILESMFYDAKEALDKCNSYDDLEEFLSHYGYRMSLTEWIESL